jgi:long-chain acyl-CoA synthetase
MVAYADRPWLQWFDEGAQVTLEPYPQVPLHRFLRDAAQKHPDNIALVTSAHLPVFGRVAASLTYAQLDQYSDALAAGLVDMGLKKGGRVALIMPNTASFVISYYAVLKAGGAVAATNPTYPAEKVQFQINDCDAEIVLTLSLFYPLVKQIQARTKVKTVIVTNVKEYLPPLARLLFTLAREKKEGHRIEALHSGDVWLPDVLARYAGQKPNVEVTPEDVAIFQYTGGTTGVPKAAVSQHKAIVANTVQSHARLLGSDPNASGANEVFLGAIPFFHVYGLITVVGFAISLGARIVLVPNARDIPDLLDVIATFKPTIFMGVPALYNAINNHPDVQSGKINVSSIRICMSGSAPLPPATKREFERLTGGKLLEGYGLSEAPTASHCNPLFGENRAGSIGIPFPDVEARIVTLEGGELEVPVGDIGELIITGPQLMMGYHNMPDETANTLRQRDGKTWLYTGDIARMDEDGYFYIVDRKKDMALIGGFNVYPSNVEKVLDEHPAVMDVGVAAVPHPEKEGQEALKAWVVLKPGARVSPEELIEHASKYLARYEVPTRYAFVQALPKSTVGKILRIELVQMELKERAEAQAE